MSLADLPWQHEGMLRELDVQDVLSLHLVSARMSRKLALANFHPSLPRAMLLLRAPVTWERILPGVLAKHGEKVNSKREAGFLWEEGGQLVHVEDDTYENTYLFVSVVPAELGKGPPELLCFFHYQHGGGYSMTALREGAKAFDESLSMEEVLLKVIQALEKGGFQYHASEMLPFAEGTSEWGAVMVHESAKLCVSQLEQQQVEFGAGWEYAHSALIARWLKQSGQIEADGKPGKAKSNCTVS